MPLLDHFRPPVLQRHPWESFHATWATEVMRTFNRKVLPPGLFAAAQIQLGGGVEVDIATLTANGVSEGHGAESNGGVAVATWAPPTTALVMPAVFPDEFTIQVFRTSGGNILVGAIEFVSPGNKDRPETRRAFAAKCATYLQQGVGLVIVDVVTERRPNLHDELIHLLEQPARFVFPQATELYTTAYRPGRKPIGDQVEIWLNPLALGQPLPIMPLALRGVGTVPVDLETTYRTACEDTRLDRPA
jgi:hypothetical protein